MPLPSGSKLFYWSFLLIQTSPHPPQRALIARRFVGDPRLIF
jgi:hypothetical protein